MIQTIDLKPRRAVLRIIIGKKPRGNDNKRQIKQQQRIENQLQHIVFEELGITGQDHHKQDEYTRKSRTQRLTNLACASVLHV